MLCWKSQKIKILKYLCQFGLKPTQNLYHIALVCEHMDTVCWLQTKYEFKPTVEILNRLIKRHKNKLFFEIISKYNLSIPPCSLYEAFLYNNIEIFIYLTTDRSFPVEFINFDQMKTKKKLITELQNNFSPLSTFNDPYISDNVEGLSANLINAGYILLDSGPTLVRNDNQLAMLKLIWTKYSISLPCLNPYCTLRTVK